MKVLVTGASGFIGSHLVEMLVRQGDEVRALVHYNSRNDRGNLEDLDSDILHQVDVRMGDITDPFQVRTLVAGCDTVYHLAALIGIPYSYHAPASYVATNVGGTLNVLEAARWEGTGRVIVTSTSEVYGTARYVPIDEDHPLQGQSPYSASKIGADKLAESYFRSFGLPVVTLRPFNTYGPRQSSRAIIPTVMVQALSGAGQIELGNLNPQRDLTYVNDTADAFLRAGSTRDIDGQTIHLGTGATISIGDLAHLILDVLGSGAEITLSAERQRPVESEVDLLVSNPARAAELLGWTPRVDLRDGLLQTAEHLKNRASARRAAEYVV